MDPVTDARALVSDRFPEARAAFLGGGVLSPHRTPTSDLDVVVLIDGLPAPYRESFRWHDWPAELFVQDARVIGAWFARDIARRRPTLARMCADGELLIDVDGTGATVRDQAKAVLAGGPPPVTQEELDRHRYGLTDLLDDLAGSTDQGRRYSSAGTFWLRRPNSRYSTPAPGWAPASGCSASCARPIRRWPVT